MANFMPEEERSQPLFSGIVDAYINYTLNSLPKSTKEKYLFLGAKVNKVVLNCHLDNLNNLNEDEKSAVKTIKELITAKKFLKIRHILMPMQTDGFWFLAFVYNFEMDLLEQHPTLVIMDSNPGASHELLASQIQNFLNLICSISCRQACHGVNLKIIHAEVPTNENPHKSAYFMLKTASYVIKKPLNINTKGQPKIKFGLNEVEALERELKTSCKPMEMCVVINKNETYNSFIKCKNCGSFSKSLVKCFKCSKEHIGSEGFQVVLDSEGNHMEMQKPEKKNIAEQNSFISSLAFSDETHKRKPLLPEKGTEDAEMNENSVELESKEESDILIQASSKDTLNQHRRITRSTTPVFLPVKLKLQSQELLVYPPPPLKGGIPLNFDDYVCLGEYQFLNDAIIDFYLKYLFLSKLSEEDQARTHIFSSFFYKCLTSDSVLNKSQQENVLPPSEVRHSRVKSWTKKVNIFEKDFIIIPINEHAHWYLAIICFPGMKGCVRMSDGTPIENQPRPKSKLSKAKNKPDPSVCAIAEPLSTTIADHFEPSSHKEESNSEGNSAHQNREQPVNEQPLQDKSTRDAIKQPCILILNSLSSSEPSSVVTILRDYLRVEHLHKVGCERDFGKTDVKGATLKVPQQSNFTDCGLYMLQYVESFFETPIEDFTLPIRSLSEWFPHEIVRGKRESIANLIKQLMVEQKVTNFKLPDISFPVITEDSSENKVDEPEAGENLTAETSCVAKPSDCAGEAQPSGDNSEVASGPNVVQKNCVIQSDVVVIETPERQKNPGGENSSELVLDIEETDEIVEIVPL